MATGGYGATRNFTGFGNNQEGGTPDLTGLSSGYGQGLAQVWNFTPQIQQQGQQSYDIMTKLLAEQKAKQDADKAAQEKAFGTPYIVDAYAGHLAQANELHNEVNNFIKDNKSNPLVQAYFNKKNNSAYDIYNPMTPEERQAGIEFEGQMSKYNQVAQNIKNSKSQFEIYEKARLANQLVTDRSIELQKQGINPNTMQRYETPAELFQAPVFGVTPKEDTDAYITKYLLPQVKQSAEATSRIVNAMKRDKNGNLDLAGNNDNWLAVENSVKSFEGQAKQMLATLWESPSHFANRQDAIYNEMQATGNPREVAAANVKKQFIDENESKLTMKALELQGLRASDYNLIYSRIGAEKKAKAKVYSTPQRIQRHLYNTPNVVQNIILNTDSKLSPIAYPNEVYNEDGSVYRGEKPTDAIESGIIVFPVQKNKDGKYIPKSGSQPSNVEKGYAKVINIPNLENANIPDKLKKEAKNGKISFDNNTNTFFIELGKGSSKIKIKVPTKTLIVPTNEEYILGKYNLSNDMSFNEPDELQKTDEVVPVPEITFDYNKGLQINKNNFDIPDAKVAAPAKPPGRGSSNLN